MSNVVLETLRRATAELHREAERALDLRRASSSLAEYESLLCRLLGFYEPLEARLFAQADHRLRNFLDLEQRRKVPALRHDLECLREDRSHDIEFCREVPPLLSGKSSVGAWYVVEGATLGGRVIGDHLARRLGLSAQTGARFFDSYGEQRSQRWSEFCEFLGSIPADEAEEVTAGAIAVFRSLRDWLTDRTLVDPTIGVVSRRAPTLPVS